MISKLIDEYLKKSENMRKGYLDSLNPINNAVVALMGKKMKEIPTMFSYLYNTVNGTSRNIKNQQYFDFIPGYRLIPIEEILDIYESFLSVYEEYENIIPFLNDYSSCYYAYIKKNNKEAIVSITEEGIEVLHDSVENFWITINVFYDNKVYFLDEDGYLSYDYELEGIFGKKYNKGISYWE